MNSRLLMKLRFILYHYNCGPGQASMPSFSFKLLLQRWSHLPANEIKWSRSKKLFLSIISLDIVSFDWFRSILIPLNKRTRNHGAFGIFALNQGFTWNDKARLGTTKPILRLTILHFVFVVQSQNMTTWVFLWDLWWHTFLESMNTSHSCTNVQT